MRKILAIFLLLMVGVMAQNTTGISAITFADYTGYADADNAYFDIEYTVKTYSDEWAEVPLFRGDAAVTESNVPLRFDDDRGYFYFYTNVPTTHTIKVSVQGELDKGAQVTSFDMYIPNAAISSLTFSIPDTAAGISVRNAVGEGETVTSGKKTITAMLKPHANTLDISWSREAEVDDKAPVVYAKVNTLTTVADSTLDTSFDVEYSILHKGIGTFSVLIPAEETVIDVGMRGMKEWKETAAGNSKRITVLLTDEYKGSRTLEIETQRVFEQKAFTTVIPEIYVEKVFRQDGNVAVNSDANAEIEIVSAAGLTRIDPSEFPMRSSSPILIAYKYSNERHSLTVSVNKYDEIPVITATIDSARQTTLITREGNSITRLVYQVKNNKKQFLRVLLPEGSTVWSTFVGGQAVKPSMKDDALLLPLMQSSTRGSELSAFPVEIIYIGEYGGMGPIGIQEWDVASADLPISQMQLSVYIPGEYDVLWNWGEMEGGTISYSPSYDGTWDVEPASAGLMMMADASPMGLGGSIASEAVEVEEFRGAVESVMVEGVAPVRVSVPSEGNLFLYKKVLVYPEDKVTHSGFYISDLLYNILLLAGFLVVAYLLYLGFRTKKFLWKKWAIALGITIVGGIVFARTFLVTIPTLLFGSCVGVCYWGYYKFVKKRK